MRHILFAPQQQHYDIAILIKETNFSKADLHTQYVSPLNAQGIASERIIAFDLEYPSKKVTAKQAKDYLAKLIPALTGLGVKYIYCADAEYFKQLTKQTKADPHLGYVLPCVYIDYMHVIYGLNYAGLVYNPNQYPKLDMSLKTLSSFVLGNFKALGGNVIHSAVNAMDAAEREKESGADKKAWVLAFVNSFVNDIDDNWERWAKVIITFIDFAKSVFNSKKRG